MNDQGDPTGVFGAAIGIISGGNKRHARLLAEYTFVIGVSVMGWYVFAGLAFLNIAAPFARASDVEELKRTVNVSARINLAQELRLQRRALCSVGDANVQSSIERVIEQLQTEYERISGERYRYADSPCPK